MLHLHTRGQRPKDITLQNAYMTTFYFIFGAEILFGEGKFVHDIMEIQTLLKQEKLSTVGMGIELLHL
jgi:hypothetical protein